MLPRLSMLSTLSVLCFILLSSQVQAKVHTFRDETTLQVTDPVDQSLGEYLAYLVSLRKALAQARPFIEEQAFVSEAQLSESKIDTLTFLLLQNQLSYLSTTSEKKNPLQVIYKTKLDYETLSFPTDISEIYLESIGDWIFVQYLLAQNKSLEKDLTDYLKKIAQSQDPAYRDLLRKTQGKVLNQKNQAFHLYDEAFLFQLKAENHKQAAETMEQIIRLNPDSVAYQLQHALLLAQMDTPAYYDRALALTGDLIDKIADDSGIRLVRSIVYFNQGLLLDRALVDVNQALQMEPDNNFAYLLKGFIALKLRNRTLALKSFASACELSAKSKAESCNARLLELSNRRGVIRRSSNRRGNGRNRRHYTLGNTLKF